MTQFQRDGHNSTSVISEHVDGIPLLLTLHEPPSVFSKYADVNPLLNHHRFTSAFSMHAGRYSLLVGHYKTLSVISMYANDSNLQEISRLLGVSKHADVIPLVLSRR